MRKDIVRQPKAGSHPIQDALGEGDQARLIVPEAMTGQSGLEKPPDPFDQIEFGRVGRQPEGIDLVCVVLEPMAEIRTLVVRRIVHHQDDRGIRPLGDDLLDEGGEFA